MITFPIGLWMRGWMQGRSWFALAAFFLRPSPDPLWKRDAKNGWRTRKQIFAMREMSFFAQNCKL